MRIAFIELAKWDYTIDTPHRTPLGGSQSALCYLAEQLVWLGHDVRLLNSVSQVTVSRGVTCAPLAKVSAGAWKDLDAVVVQNYAKIGVELRPLLRPNAKLILWTQHADDQPAIQALADPAVRNAYDAFALVSQWQRDRYIEVYRIDPRKSHVLRNAIGPAFENLFSNGDVLRHKSDPPILAYTSTPFRGLDVLLEVFPRIRSAAPATRLRIYSSMQVYQVSAEKDAAKYGQLYEKCRSTPGVEYIGSLPQPELAKALSQASVLAYPNHFAETSCIAVMEALASGCKVVTSSFGALPETTGGFGTLIPKDQSYRDRFVQATIDVLESFTAQPEAINAALTKQVAWINQECNWRKRACEWQTFLAL